MSKENKRVESYSSDASSSSLSSLDDENHQNENDDNESGDVHLNLLQAVCFIEDAIGYKSIFHSCRTKNDIKWYRLYHSWQIKFIIGLSIFMVNCLPFVEYPSSLSYTSDTRKAFHRYQINCTLLLYIELLTLIILTFDVIFKTVLKLFQNSLKEGWLLTYYLILFISFIDWSLTMANGSNCSPNTNNSLQYFSSLQIRRYFRPFFLLQSSTLMKKILHCMQRSMKPILSVGLLLVFHLFFFALMGILIFPRNRNGIPIHDDEKEAFAVFDSISHSLIHLLVLLTTANHPDVMMLAYAANRLYVIYFVIFVFFGTYCMVSMVTAVMYNVFQTYFLDSMQSAIYRHKMAIYATFRSMQLYERLLYKRQTIKTFVRLTTIEKMINLTKLSNLKKYNIKLLLQTFLDLQKQPRRLIDLTNSSSTSTTDIDSDNDAHNNRYNIQFMKPVIYRSDGRSENLPYFFSKPGNFSSIKYSNYVSMDVHQFEYLMRELNENEKIISVDDSITRTNVTTTDIAQQIRRRSLSRIPETQEQTFLHRLRVFGQSKLFHHLGDLVALINIIMITWELEVEVHGGRKAEKIRKILNAANSIFLIFYCFEQALKIWSYGIYQYMQSLNNVFDLFVTLFLMAAEGVSFAFLSEPFDFTPDFNSTDTRSSFFFNNSTNLTTTIIPSTVTPSNIIDRRIQVWDIVRIINILIMFRLIRLMKLFRTMSIILNALIDLVKNLGSFFGLLWSLYYFFALCGMQLFSGTIRPDIAPFNLTNQTTTAKCGSYEQLNYWANNFDDFASSVVVLWDIMVVNNWQVFLNVFSRVTNEWYQLYFIIWWFISTICTMSIFTAIILELFLSKLAAAEQTEKKKKELQTQMNRTPTPMTRRNRFQKKVLKPRSPKATTQNIATVYQIFESRIKEPTNEYLMQNLNRHPDLKLT
ncbi:hypothetical protein SNEBB_011103 [Seison nebaliae]|nr:hypothetical protein SNEBB_011103 [Seison nebaliae]